MNEKAQPDQEVNRERMHARVESDFSYHAPRDPTQVALYQTLRDKAKDLAQFIVDAVPVSREQSSALTNLEQAIFHANAGIARHG